MFCLHNPPDWCSFVEGPLTVWCPLCHHRVRTSPRSKHFCSQPPLIRQWRSSDSSRISFTSACFLPKSEQNIVFKGQIVFLFIYRRSERVRVHFDMWCVVRDKSLMICMRCKWDVNQMSVRFQWGISEMSMRCQWDISETLLSFQWDISEISMRYQWDFSEISMRCQRDVNALALYYGFTLQKIFLWLYLYKYVDLDL